MSIGWFFPPGVLGWLGLTDLVLGVDPSAPGYAMFHERIDAFSESVGNLGGIPVTNGGLRAQGFRPSVAEARLDDILAALALLSPSDDGG